MNPYYRYVIRDDSDDDDDDDEEEEEIIDLNGALHGGNPPPPARIITHYAELDDDDDDYLGYDTDIYIDADMMTMIGAKPGETEAQKKTIAKRKAKTKRDRERIQNLSPKSRDKYRKTRNQQARNLLATRSDAYKEERRIKRNIRAKLNRQKRKKTHPKEEAARVLDSKLRTRVRWDKIKADPEKHTELLKNRRKKYEANKDIVNKTARDKRANESEEVRKKKRDHAAELARAKRKNPTPKQDAARLLKNKKKRDKRANESKEARELRLDGERKAWKLKKDREKRQKQIAKLAELMQHSVDDGGTETDDDFEKDEPIDMSIYFGGSN